MRADRATSTCRSCWNFDKQVRQHNVTVSALGLPAQVVSDLYLTIATYREKVNAPLLWSDVKDKILTSIALTHEKRRSEIGVQKERPMAYWIRKGFARQRIKTWPWVHVFRVEGVGLVEGLGFVA